MERLRKTLMAMTLCLLALSSCTNYDEPEYKQTAPDYYVYTFNFATQGTDEQDVVDTTISYIDDDGKYHDTSMDYESLVYRSGLVKTFPSKREIIISQTHKVGFVPEKSTYSLGLGVSLSVTSVNTEGQVIDTEERSTSGYTEVPAASLGSYLPRSQTYIITADADGQLEITMK